MSDASRVQQEAGGSHQAGHPGLAEVCSYPLLSALAERRTRRVSKGTSILAGDLSHTSTSEPAPLSPLEEAILVVSTGLTGAVMHDGPLHTPDGDKELGTPFLNIIGRSASSADNAQATSFFMINDDGIWLLKRPRGREAVAILDQLSPKREDWSEEDWLAAAAAVKRKVYDQRLEFPRRFPYYLGWNKQISNRPGTTILLPVVDCTRAVINILLIMASEPDGQRPLFVDDWQRFRPKTFIDWMAWVGMKLRLSPNIPYHPVGGIKRVRSGFVNPDLPLPLGVSSTMRVDYEAFFLMQNLMLVGQAVGLGGWVHASTFPPYIFERDPERGVFGLGFRMHTPDKKWRHDPPPPTTQPNPVGIDGVLEGLCPPYVKSMNDAVDEVCEEKYGSMGTYGDKDVFARSYASKSSAEEFLRIAAPFSKEAIKYTKEICTYIYETYGRFPAHVDAFHLPGIWVQFSHLELDYYEKYFSADLFSRQARHYSMWGDH